MDHLLTLDVGVTTGYCLLEQGIVKQVGDIPLENLRDALIALRLYFYQCTPGKPPFTVVMEEPIPFGVGKLAQDLRKAMGVVREVFPEAHSITANQWKGTGAFREPLPDPKDPRWSQHQKDAYRIAKWWTNYR